MIVVVVVVVAVAVVWLLQLLLPQSVSFCSNKMQQEREWYRIMKDYG